MNKLTKYACILTAVAGAVACSGGKKAQGDYRSEERRVGKECAI